MAKPNIIVYVLKGGASNQVQRIIGILTNQQKSIWNLGSVAYFEYTSCYFKVVIDMFHKQFVPS
jgi:hypothetical protein